MTSAHSNRVPVDVVTLTTTTAIMTRRDMSRTGHFWVFDQECDYSERLARVLMQAGHEVTLQGKLYCSGIVELLRRVRKPPDFVVLANDDVREVGRLVSVACSITIVFPGRCLVILPKNGDGVVNHRLILKANKVPCCVSAGQPEADARWVLSHLTCT